MKPGKPLRRRTPISRSRLKRKGPNPNKLRAGRVPKNPKYVAWSHTRECIGVRSLPGHICEGRLEFSHLRSHTGMGLKEPDEHGALMDRRLHMHWEQHSGPFAGWSNEQRRVWMWERIIEEHAAYEIETGVVLAVVETR